MHQTLLHTHMYITPPLLMARSKCTIRDIPTTNSCIIMCTYRQLYYMHEHKVRPCLPLSSKLIEFPPTLRPPVSLMSTHAHMEEREPNRIFEDT